MKTNTKASLLAAVITTGLAVLMAGCPAPGAPGGPGSPGSATSSGTVDPNTCGNYAATDAGRKLKAFLEATVQLDRAVQSSESYLRDTCALMGRELGVAVDGDTRTVCMNVSNALEEHLSIGLQPGAQLQIQYQPAVCTVNAEVAANAAAQCEAQAQAQVAVRCDGVCEGTCQGTCEGTCAGAADGGGAAGECNGECQGTCRGTCTGSCRGHADVDASASCQARAEVAANVEAECTEPELEVTFDAAVVVDKSKVEAAARAIRAGLPRILMIHAKMTGPVKAAFVTWSRTATELANSGQQLVSSLGAQAMCVLNQVRAAAAMLASIEASISVQVEVSASVEASASGAAGGSAGAGARAPHAN